MTNKKSNNDKNGYLFSIEVLIEGHTNGHALELLTRILNSEEVTDYRVIKGINLGEIIESAVKRHQAKSETGLAENKAALKSAATAKKKDASEPIQEPDLIAAYRPIIEQIEQYKENRTLVRLSILKGKGIKLSIPCRILNYDWSTRNITVYHVDEKKVYLFQLNEIDDLTAN